MTAQQIIFYAILLALAALYLRNFLRKKSIVHYSAESVRHRLEAKEKIILLDVRSAGERSARHIKGSIHIPLPELKRRLGELSKYKDREIVCYCQSGARSLSAAAVLKEAGFRVANLDGGISSWMFNE